MHGEALAFVEGMLLGHASAQLMKLRMMRNETGHRKSTQMRTVKNPLHAVGLRARYPAKRRKIRRYVCPGGDCFQLW